MLQSIQIFGWSLILWPITKIYCHSSIRKSEGKKHPNLASYFKNWHNLKQGDHEDPREITARDFKKY